MLYSSPEFLVFLLAVVGTLAIFRGKTARFWVLLAASMFFYAWGTVLDLLVFLVVVVVSWVATALALRYPKRKIFFLAVGIIAMALHLFLWKYSYWFVTSIQLVFPAFLGGKSVHFPLPIGVSFFTLQGIAYLVDYARGEAPFLRLKEYLLFKSFFPQLIAGPIVRVHQLLPQIQALRRPVAADYASGLSLFILGFSKKILIADNIAPIVDPIFLAPAAYDRVSLFAGILAYTVQIWADFSGYTDMGRGAARILGFQLPENFLSPYLARSPSEFWRRWHITLSQWIRDYIYIPLGGNKGSRARAFCVLIFTMAISGLWHGANFTFVFWGVYHGLLLVAERLLSRSVLSSVYASILPAPLRELGLWLVMFTATMFGWLLFRSLSLEAAGIYLRGMFTGGGATAISARELSVVGLALGYCFAVQILGFENFARGGRIYWEKAYTWFAEIHPLRRGLLAGGSLAAAALVVLFFRRVDAAAPFIYFQF